MKKILFLSGHDIFEKIAHGGIIVSKGNYDILADAFGEKNVYSLLITGNTFDEKKHVKCIPKHKNKYEYFVNSLFLRGRYNVKKEKLILQYIKEKKFDLIFFDGSLYGKVVKKARDMGIETIVFFHNIEKDFAYNIMKKGGWIYFPQYFSAWYNEKLSVNYGNKLIVLNERDKQKLNIYYEKEPDIMVPVWHTDIFAPQRDKTESGIKNKTLLFVGNAGLQPNVDGIKWFVKNVMVHLSEFTLLIVGRGFEDYRDTITGKNIKIIGTVAELDDYYYKAGAIVSPIQYGTGMKTKTAEALMYGKAIFASDEALTGYQVTDTYGIWRCNDAEEYIRCIREFWANGNISLVQAQVRNLFLKKYEKDAVNSQYISQLLN